MVKMTVGEQDTGETLEPNTGLEYLALSALAAIDQKTILVVFDDLGGEAATG
jgi:hypothetical protein